MFPSNWFMLFNHVNILLNSGLGRKFTKFTFKVVCSIGLFNLSLQECIPSQKVSIWRFLLGPCRREIPVISATGEVDIFGFESAVEGLTGVGQLLGELKQLGGHYVSITHFGNTLEFF